MSTVHAARLPVSIEIPVNHEVRTIRGALLDRINIQAEPKSLDDIAADKERRGALEEVKQKATRDLQRATAAAERKQATKAAEAARIVEEKAASASKVKARKASQDEKREADKETSLRDWLSKSLDCRILDRTLEALEREDVFFVADLAMFCALPRFNECLTALTREKVLNALKDEGLISSTAPVPPSPLGPDDSTPDWLAEAECIVFEKPETPPPESPMLMKFEDFPPMETAREGDLLGDILGDMRHPMETAREGDLLGLSPGDMLSKSSPGAVPAAAAGLRPQPRFQEPRGCEDGEMGSNVSLDEDEEDDEEDSDDDFVKEKPEPTAPKAPAPAPPPAAKAAPKKAHGSDDDEAENVPIKKALTVNPAGVDPAMRIADETQLDKKRQKAPAAGAAHDAGIDYGVLASDIAADNMSAHIAANEDEYVAKKTKPEKVKMKPMRRPDHGMRAARPSCPADPAMMIADETPFGNLIVLKKSGEEGGMCEMKNDVLLIGRDPEKCDIEIRLPEASRMQARLTVDEYRQVWIENLSQTNPLGTLLNDERCDGQPHLLANKDIITICGRRFRFEYCNAEVLAKPTDATGNVIKPAMSSYLHFCQERRPMVTQQLKAILGAEFKQAAVMSQLGAEWKDLPDATKAKFTSMAKSDKTRYDAAF
eukprot:jgi/Chrpa1/9410/Chrysochromulina_OHIO_Genome00019899-RA